MELMHKICAAMTGMNANDQQDLLNALGLIESEGDAALKTALIIVQAGGLYQARALIDRALAGDAAAVRAVRAATDGEVL